MSIRRTLGKIYVPTKYFLFKHMPKSMWPRLIRLAMRIELGEKVDLKNPTTFNEKIQWIKLNDRRPIKSLLADKYEVRRYVSDTIGEKYLVPLIGMWERFDDIPFDALPEKFVMKATHGCGCNIIVNDKKLFDKEDARKKFHKWFNTNYAYYTGELQYLNIKPRIIVEVYLENNGGDLYDYKVFCFNGKAKYIMFLSERKQGLKMAFYNTSWEKQDFTYSYPRLESEVQRPNCLTELIEVAEQLSADFDTARVDFYILNDGSIKFGEITFASAGGFCKWKPPIYNKILGDLIELNKEKRYE